VVKKGLIVGASSEEFDPWSTTIEYEVSTELRDRLIELEADLIESFSDS